MYGQPNEPLTRSRERVERRPIVSKLVRWKPTDMCRLSTAQVPMDFSDRWLHCLLLSQNSHFNLIRRYYVWPRIASEQLNWPAVKKPSCESKQEPEKCECSATAEIYESFEAMEGRRLLDRRLRVWMITTPFHLSPTCTKTKLAWSSWVDRSIELSYQKKKRLGQKIVFLFQLMISLSLTINLVSLFPRAFLCFMYCLYACVYAFAFLSWPCIENRTCLRFTSSVVCPVWKLSVIANSDIWLAANTLNRENINTHMYWANHLNYCRLKRTDKITT